MAATVKLSNFSQPSGKLVVLISKGAGMNSAAGNRFSPNVSILLFGMITLLAASAAGQGFGFHGEGGIAPRGVPASVTAFGFGGHPGFHGVPASVTSLGFGARNNFRGVPGSVTSVGFGDGRRGFHERPLETRHRHHNDFRSPFYGGYYGYAPYAYPYYLNSEDYNQDDSPANNAPEVRDYRGDDDRKVLEEDYRAGLNPSQEQISQSPAQPVAAQPSTVLIFKDGHQQEISNYAIVGDVLYELSDQRSKKVQLADLDLTATIKENDQRGVEFQVPAATRLN